MGLLHTEFASGNMFTAGSDYGDTGTSGLNEITHRINILTLDGNHVTGSLISGTSTSLYGNFAGIYAGEGIDFDNGSVIIGEDTTVTNKGIIELATEDEVQTGTDTARAVVPDTLQTIAPPIGTIMAWLKSFTSVPQSLPTGWVECDGSVLSDADSVLNGETLPDLNGGEFLRGAATSGDTGGADTVDLQHTHTGPEHNHQWFETTSNNTYDASGNEIDINEESTDDSVGYDVWRTDTQPDSYTKKAGTGATGNGGSTTQDVKPKFHTVVWIMRIK